MKKANRAKLEELKEAKEVLRSWPSRLPLRSILKRMLLREERVESWKKGQESLLKQAREELKRWSEECHALRKQMNQVEHALGGAGYSKGGVLEVVTQLAFDKRAADVLAEQYRKQLEHLHAEMTELRKQDAESYEAEIKDLKERMHEARHRARQLVSIRQRGERTAEAVSQRARDVMQALLHQLEEGDPG